MVVRIAERDLFNHRVTAPTPTEFAIHASLVDLLERPGIVAPGWRWTHFPAGEARPHEVVKGRDGKWKRVSAAGNRLRRMGVRAGVPDLIFWGPEGRCCFLELKSQGGRLSAAQNDWRTWAIEHPYGYAVAHSFAAAVAALDAWGVLVRRARPQ